MNQPGPGLPGAQLVEVEEELRDADAVCDAVLLDPAHDALVGGSGGQGDVRQRMGPSLSFKREELGYEAIRRGNA